MGRNSPFPPLGRQSNATTSIPRQQILYPLSTIETEPDGLGPGCEWNNSDYILAFSDLCCTFSGRHGERCAKTTVHRTVHGSVHLTGMGSPGRHRGCEFHLDAASPRHSLRASISLVSRGREMRQ